MPENPSIWTDAVRIRRLDTLTRIAGWWLLLLGLGNLMMGDRLSWWLDLRYHVTAYPTIRLLGLCYLCIAFFVRRSLEEPEQQYLGIDLLILFFWGQVCVILMTKNQQFPVFKGEWAIFAVNLAFAIGLTWLRSKPRGAEASKPGAKDAKLAAKATIARLKELLEEKKRRNPIPRGIAPVTHASEPKPDDSKPKISEAAPHMD